MRIDKIASGFSAIDIGQESFHVAVSGQPVKRFGTFTREIELLAEFLRQHNVTQVAMEATGVYWIPLHDYLDSNDFVVTVFNGASARNMPGRKTDVQDCQWHAMLHSHGLLQPCFIPPPDIRELRGFYRLREDHIGLGAMHIQHMQKALDLMNVRLHHVISQIHGVSGLRVIEAILAGERNPEHLLLLCAQSIRTHKKDEVLASLEGNWQAHHLFALRQGLEGYRFCQAQALECDKQIEAVLKRWNEDKEPQPAQGHGITRHNAPQIPNLLGQLVTLCEGIDATVLPGIGTLTFLKLISELGTDLSPWPRVQQFTSWLGLAPGRNESGKKRRRAPRRKTAAGQILREAVMSLARSKDVALGAFYRRIKARRGAAIAIMATARKLAELYYWLMTKGMEYVEQGIIRYEAQVREQSIQRIKKAARYLGLEVIETGSAVTP